MTETGQEEAQVTYSVRELLEQIRVSQAQAFARLEANLAVKADKADVARMEVRLDHHGQRLDNLEGWKNHVEITDKVRGSHIAETSVWKRRVLAAAISVGMLFATIFGPYLGAHLHF